MNTRRPLSAQVVKLMSERIQSALSDITDSYSEVRQWCYVLPYRSIGESPVQVSGPSDPTGQTMLKREELSRSLEREVCRRMDRAYDELAGAANWLRHVQEYGE